jgi:5-methylcytosine-specific restriction protein A
MPRTPLKLCAHHGCNARVSWRDRFCEPHRVTAAREREARRPARTTETGATTSGGGRSGFWRALRKSCLERDPVCKSCHEKPATHADHIVPKSAGGRDALENLEGLCHSCHSRKTAATDGGFGNPRRGHARGSRANR